MPRPACRYCGQAIRWDGSAWVNGYGSDECRTVGEKPGWAHNRPMGTSHAPEVR